MQIQQLSRKIQYAKKISRSKSLVAAWPIHQQADLMVYYLIRKHTPPNRSPETIANNLTLIY